MNPSPSVASRLHPLQRQEIAIKVLTKQEPITQIANQEQVSRKFIYQQKAIALNSSNSILAITQCQASPDRTTNYSFRARDYI